MEEIAANWLEKRGCVILERQYRTPAGEIDLIYKDGNTFVFAEVKYRSSADYGMPAEAVNGQKRRRIIKAAMWYMGAIGWPDQPLRFDVVELLRYNKTLYIRRIYDAFSPEM